MATAERCTIDEVKLGLERLIADAESGRSAEILRGGRVVARIVPGLGRVGRGRGTAEVHGDLLAPSARSGNRRASEGALERFMIGTALVHDLPLMTVGRRIRGWGGVRTIG